MADKINMSAMRKRMEKDSTAGKMSSTGSAIKSAVQGAMKSKSMPSMKMPDDKFSPMLGKSTRIKYGDKTKQIADKISKGSDMKPMPVKSGVKSKMKPGIISGMRSEKMKRKPINFQEMDSEKFKRVKDRIRMRINRR